MKVAKFGGSSLASGEQIRKVADIILEDNNRQIIVVSAPGKRHDDDIKVTDLLIDCAKQSLEHDQYKFELQRVLNRYKEIARDLDINGDILKRIEADLVERLKMSKKNKGKYMDTLKAAGEDNLAKLMAEYLKKRDVKASYIDPKDAGLILTEEYGNACIVPSSFDNLKKLREKEGICVFPGFFGYSQKGDIVTFPRGGSDITGAILAAAVSADEYENFTDVDNVFAANPKIISNPVGIKEFTYREMRELSYAGFSVLHEETLEPVYKAHIPVCIKNTNNPNGPGTYILPERKYDPERPVVGIAAQSGFVSVYISKYLMNRQVGFSRKVLQILEEMGIPYEHMPSGIDNISIILKEKNFSNGLEKIFTKRVKEELCVDEIQVQRDLAIVMIVGEGMLMHIGTAGRATSALARYDVNIHMINQGSSEVGIMFGILAEDSKKAVEGLYEEFFGDL